MIYTSYFAKMKKFPENFYPVAICQYPPKWYTGPVYKKLAPTWDILREYKESNKSEKEKQERYLERFRGEILSKVPEVSQMVRELERVAGIKQDSNTHIVLLCFEKTGDFCHRNEVASYFTERGVCVREATEEDFQQEKSGYELE